jgi:DNA-binding response OmpR family regulator/tetratricopeptide (TPR) repeat protein
VVRRSDTLIVGHDVVDVGARTLHRVDGRIVRLSRLEIRLLQALAAEPGATVDRRTLATSVWGRNTDDDAVVKLVQRLRRKVEEEPDRPRLVVTEGAGYRLEREPTHAKTSRGPVLEVGDRTIDLDRHRVRGATSADLTSLEVRLLRLLAERDHALSREAIRRELWEGTAGDARSVDRVVHRLRAKLEQDPAAPVHLVTVRGAGYRLRIDPGSGADESAFVGRELELVALERAWFEGASAITVAGPPGIGTSRLVEQFARRRQGTRLHVNLAGVRSAREALERVAHASACVAAHADAASILRHLVARRVGLLVLDGSDAIEGWAEILSAWLPARGAPRIVCAARAAVGLPHERVVTLGPLARSDAMHLFRARVRALGAAAPDHAAIGPMVEELGGVPRAIELAAAHVVRGTRALGAIDRNSGEIVHTVLASAVASLAPDVAAAIPLLTVFDGDLATEAASFVLGRPAAAVLERLRRSGLVLDGARGRVRLVPGLERILAVRESDVVAARQRHVAWFARLAEDAIRGEDLATESVLHALEPEAANLAAAFDASAQPESVWLALALASLALHRGPFERGLEILARFPSDAPAAAHRALLSGQLHFLTGRYGVATVELQRAIELARRDDLTASESTALRHLGGIHQRLGQTNAARDAFGRALELGQRTGDARLVGAALQRIGVLDRVEGRLAEAEAAVVGALERYRSVGDRTLEAHAMVDRAILALESARLEEAEALHIEALAAEAAHGTPRFEGNVAMSLARLYAETGRLDDAAALADRALALHGALGNPTAEAIALSLQALVAEERGDLELAESTFVRALEIHEAFGNARSMGVALSNLGRVAHLRGDLSRAAERHDRAISALREAGDRRLLPYALAVQRAVIVELEEVLSIIEPSDDPAIVAMHAMIDAWARREELPEVGPAAKRSQDVRLVRNLLRQRTRN